MTSLVQLDASPRLQAQRPHGMSPEGKRRSMCTSVPLGSMWRRRRGEGMPGISQAEDPTSPQRERPKCNPCALLVLKVACRRAPVSAKVGVRTAGACNVPCCLPPRPCLRDCSICVWPSTAKIAVGVCSRPWLWLRQGCV